MASTLIRGLGGTKGFGEHSLTRNDDGSTGLVDIRSVFGTAGLNFYGHHYTGLYVNNNGNVTFASPQAAFTPSVITGSTSNPIIATLFQDVDTRGGSHAPSSGGNSTGSNLVYYDLTPNALTVTWDDVGYYSSHINLSNAYQLQLIDRNNGNFDIVFRYEVVNWTTGDASGGSGGFGGVVARAGWSAGDGEHYYEIAASGNQAAVLGLDNNLGNSGQSGQWIWQVRSGEVQYSDIQFNSIETLARFSRAAYALRADEPLTNAATNTYRNDPAPNGADTAALVALDADGWVRLGSRDLSETLTVTQTQPDGQFHEGIENGIYTNANAAALVARSSDTLVIAFRGTNDSRESTGAFWNPFTNTPDQVHWTGMSSHYALYAPLINALNAYVADAANGIDHVYVTGHSLGAAMVEPFMNSHPNAGGVDYHAITYATPGYGLDAAQLNDARTTNFRVAGDGIASSPYGALGDLNTWQLSVNFPDISTLPADHNQVSNQRHAMDLYLSVADRIAAAGLDVGAFRTTDGVDIDNFYTRVLGTHQLNTANARDDTYAFSEPNGSTIVAANQASVMLGTAGVDLLTGGLGADRVLGLGAADVLTGGSGNDTLTGGNGGDTLFGGLGNDILTGGAGVDRSTGGANADRFDFDAAADSGLTVQTRDIVLDFVRAQGDKIDLSGIDANAAAAGNQAFVFIGGAAFSGNAAGRLRFDSANHFVLGSTDADTAAEFSIQVNGISSMLPADFVL